MCKYFRYPLIKLLPITQNADNADISFLYLDQLMAHAHFNSLICPTQVTLCELHLVGTLEGRNLF